jgi:hypothetical protein
MENYLKYFGLTANYTNDELKNAYNKKINLISRLDISDIDKYFFIKQTRTQYKYLKNNHLYYNHNIFDSFAKIFDNNTSRNNNSNYSSYSNFRTYSEKLNNDGTKTINETIKTNKNGIEEKKVHAYKKYPDGKIEKINLLK